MDTEAAELRKRLEELCRGQGIDIIHINYINEAAICYFGAKKNLILFLNASAEDIFLAISRIEKSGPLQNL